MKISEVVRMALAKGKKKNADLSRFLGLSSPTVLNNKLVRDSWSADDLAKVAAFTGGRLVIQFPDGVDIPVMPEDAE